MAEAYYREHVSCADVIRDPGNVNGTAGDDAVRVLQAPKQSLDTLRKKSFYPRSHCRPRSGRRRRHLQLRIPIAGKPDSNGLRYAWPAKPEHGEDANAKLTKPKRTEAAAEGCDDPIDVVNTTAGSVHPVTYRVPAAPSAEEHAESQAQRDLEGKN